MADIISAEDQAIFRSADSAAGRATINWWPKRVVGTAVIDGNPDWSGVVRGLDIRDKSMGFSIDLEGQLIRITKPDGSLVYESAVRNPSEDGDRVFLQPIRQGDTGIAAEIANYPEDGDLLEVFDIPIPKSSASIPADDTGEILKRGNLRFDLAYPQTRYPRPQPNIGEHKHYRVDPITGLATFDLNVDIFDFLGGSSWTILWILPAGVTPVSGTVADAALTVEAEPGLHLITCRVRRYPGGGLGDKTTDRGDARRFYWVTDGETVTPFSDTFDVRVLGGERTRSGREMTLEIGATTAEDESALAPYFYAGAPVLLTLEPRYSDDGWATSAPAPASALTNFFGYVHSFERVSHDYQHNIRYIVRVVSPFLLMEEQLFAPQELRAVASPTNWQEIWSGIANLAYAMFYVISYHVPTVAMQNDLNLTDYLEFEFPTIGISNGTIADALRDIAAYVPAGNIGCAASGALVARRHVSLEDSSYRSTRGVLITHTAGDVEEKIEFPRAFQKRASQIIGEGLVSGTDLAGAVGVTVRSGLYAPAQGPAPRTMHSLIGESLNAIRARVMRYDTYFNRPTLTVEWNIVGYMDVFDPAQMQPHGADFGAVYDPLRTGILESPRTLLPVRVSETWEYDENKDVTIQLSVEMETESDTHGILAPVEPVDVLGAPMAPVTTLTFEREFDFTDGLPHGWEAVNFYGGGSQAGNIQADGWHYNDGLSSAGSYSRMVLIRRNFSDRQITSIEFTFERTGGSIGAGLDWWRIEGNTSILANNAGTPGTGTLTKSWTGSGSMSSIRLLARASQANSATYSGSTKLTRVRVRGIGTDPF